MVGVLLQRWSKVQEEGTDGPDSGEVGIREKNKPQFSVKMKGGEGFVGSGWLNDSKFGGKYVAVKVNSAIPAGSTIYVSPTKANPGLLG
ncbi:MAG: hypothetical protein WC792_02180 [Candidatus Micrarchaeia archaeon]|jgi:hypothetical protein